ncbi:4Fe-4S binding protein [Desulfosporosinus fructosivorans]|uniref:4Fe-4S binding protein n=1 Tax=Desulfosporosinus fructosivorans TaxID=2018669 RepID=A0A4Z0R3J9_9FIRM|nr:4Fe-4S binding protein [Desulfosporosinus fructosivorans]
MIVTANISAVLLTILFVLSVFCGRFFCGRICPFGLLQDLLNKIPFPKKIRSFKGDKHLRYMKYVLLMLMVAANLFGYSTTSMNEAHTFNAGLASGWAMFALLCIVISRPLCKYLCPVGPILGWCNLLPFGEYKVNQESCTKCGVCLDVCKMDIEPYKTPNHIECIRCGKCKKNCPSKAITSGFLKK